MPMRTGLLRAEARHIEEIDTETGAEQLPTGATRRRRQCQTALTDNGRGLLGGGVGSNS